jgi:hypothetical protein
MVQRTSGSINAYQHQDTPSTSSTDTDSLAADLLYGSKAIGEFLGKSRRIVLYMLERGQLPATKTGSLWVASKAKLRERFTGDAA